MFFKSSFHNEKGQPWIMIIPSVHQMLAHTWEIFAMNDGKSVANVRKSS